MPFVPCLFWLGQTSKGLSLMLSTLVKGELASALVLRYFYILFGFDGSLCVHSKHPAADLRGSTSRLQCEDC